MSGTILVQADNNERLHQTLGRTDHNFGVHDVIPLFTPHQNQRS